MESTTPKPVKVFIALRHNYLFQTSEATVEQVLYGEYESDYTVRIEHVLLQPYHQTTIEHQAISQIDWSVEAAHQQQCYEQIIKPLLDKHLDATLVYFGAAPVPLTIHLGYLLSSWTTVTVYLKRHTGDKEWYRYPSAVSLEDTAQLYKKGIPSEDNHAPQDVLLKVETSYAISDEEWHDALGNELVIAKTIDIRLEPLQLDVVSIDQLHEITKAFTQAINAIANHLKQTDTVHLIAAVPTGLAFLLGNQLVPNVHKPVQTYQYHQNDDLKYSPALKVGLVGDSTILLTDEEKARAQQLKRQFGAEWARIKQFVENTAELAKAHDNWYQCLVKLPDYHAVFDFYFWKDLPKIEDTPLKGSRFDAEKVEVPTDFEYDSDTECWAADEGLVHQIAQRFEGNDEQILAALRLLYFHEGMHYWSHGLRSETASGIGRFPKILEAADYQADVWAMLHEYQYCRSFAKVTLEGFKAERDFFLQLIDTAIGTMWAFDDGGRDLQQMQIRRINRYLIWYWQRLRIAGCDRMDNILRILAEMPIVELKGLPIKVENQRVYYRLTRPKNTNLELGILWKQKIRRLGNLDSFNIPDLIAAFRQRDHAALTHMMKKAYGAL